MRKRFGISLVITLPVLVLSPMLKEPVGLREAIRFHGDPYKGGQLPKERLVGQAEHAVSRFVSRPRLRAVSTGPVVPRCASSKALHWLKDMLDSEHQQIVARIRRLLDDPTHADTLRADLQHGLPTLSIWLQSVIREVL